MNSRPVRFPLINGEIVFPDDAELFGPTEVIGETVFCEYFEPIQYKKQITLREFILMLTPQELRFIEVKTKTDDDILYFWAIVKAGGAIDLENPVIIVGLAALVDKNVLSQERHDTIMLGLPA